MEENPKNKYGSRYNESEEEALINRLQRHEIFAKFGEDEKPSFSVCNSL